MSTQQSRRDDKNVKRSKLAKQAFTEDGTIWLANFLDDESFNAYIVRFMTTVKDVQINSKASILDDIARDTENNKANANNNKAILLAEKETHDDVEGYLTKGGVNSADAQTWYKAFESTTSNLVVEMTATLLKMSTAAPGMTTVAPEHKLRVTSVKKDKDVKMQEDVVDGAAGAAGAVGPKCTGRKNGSKQSKDKQPAHTISRPSQWTKEMSTWILDGEEYAVNLGYHFPLAGAYKQNMGIVVTAQATQDANPDKTMAECIAFNKSFNNKVGIEKDNVHIKDKDMPVNDLAKMAEEGTLQFRDGAQRLLEEREDFMAVDHLAGNAEIDVAEITDPVTGETYWVVEGGNNSLNAWAVLLMCMNPYFARVYDEHGELWNLTEEQLDRLRAKNVRVHIHTGKPQAINKLTQQKKLAKQQDPWAHLAWIKLRTMYRSFGFPESFWFVHSGGMLASAQVDFACQMIDGVLCGLTWLPKKIMQEAQNAVKLYDSTKDEDKDKKLDGNTINGAMRMMIYVIMTSLSSRTVTLKIGEGIYLANEMFFNMMYGAGRNTATMTDDKIEDTIEQADAELLKHEEKYPSKDAILERNKNRLILGWKVLDILRKMPGRLSARLMCRIAPIIVDMYAKSHLKRNDDAKVRLFSAIILVAFYGRNAECVKDVTEKEFPETLFVMPWHKLHVFQASIRHGDFVKQMAETRKAAEKIMDEVYVSDVELILTKLTDKKRKSGDVE